MCHTTQAPAGSSITLHDGRRLGYADFGDPAGSPVVFLHGWCGSRLARHPDDALATSFGVRVITVDRPGVGLSDRKPRRTLLDWPDVLRELLDAMHLQRVGVFGHSAGGPHALACGVRLADRVRALGVVCGFAPMDRTDATQGMQAEMRRGVGLFRRLPWLAGPTVRSLPAAYQRDSAAAWEAQFGRHLPACDRMELNRPGVRDNLLAAALEAMRSGSSGIADELPLFLGQPWQFDPASVRVRTWLWYGQDDVIAPVQMGRFLASRIPDSQLVEYPSEGHLVYVTHWTEILRALTSTT